MTRPSDKHIDSEELSILVPWATDPGTGEAPRASVETLREVHRHLAKCSECRKRLLGYRRIVDRLSNATTSAAMTGSSCPKEIDWKEVVAGLWPELKAQQLIRHAALCDYCGPMLREATRHAGPRPSREVADPYPSTRPAVLPARRWQLLAWLIPVCSAMAAIAIFVGIPMASSTALSGTKYAEFAARIHAQHVQGSLALDVHSNSQQAVNDWLRQNAQFSVSLPGAPEVPKEKQPYQLEGASLVKVGGQHAAFVAYQLDSGPASLIIAPHAVAVASGGVEAPFNKVTFHYRTVNGLKVVTWSQHGLTYALVSQEGTRTQKSCMVCHSAMKDRDLSQTPTPLAAEKNTIRSYLQ